MLQQTEKSARLMWDWVPTQTLQIFEHLCTTFSRHYSSCTYVDMNAKDGFSTELCYGRQRSERFVEDLEKKNKTRNKIKPFKLITFANIASTQKV